MTANPPSSTPAYTVVYDGQCTVCGHLAEVLRSWDRTGIFEIVPSTVADIEKRFPSIPLADYKESMQLFGPGGQRWQGAASVEQILRLLPKGKLVAWVFGIPFMRPLAERGYRWFARNRYKFGCGDHCSIRPR